MSSTDTLIPDQPPTQATVPDHIVKAVNEGKCILFLGARASTPSPSGCRYQYRECPPDGKQLSQELARQCDYPDDDKTNLARVSLYYATRKDKNRHSLINAIAEAVANDRLVPSPAMHMLAALPFRIIVTTNYDGLFDMALCTARTMNGRLKQPLIQVYDPKRKEQPDADEVPLDIQEEKPVLLKLHGDINVYDSIVITEEDYITFIQRMSDVHLHPIHENIRARMKQWPILFIGYSLRDYNLRLLFRALRWSPNPGKFPLSYSVDPKPDNLIMSVWQDVGEKERIVYFVQTDLWDFVPALYKACRGKDYQTHEQGNLKI